MSSPSATASSASVASEQAKLPMLRALLVLSAVTLSFATLPLARAVVAAITAGALVVLSAIDIETGLIPNRIVLPAAAVVAGSNILLFPGRALEWMLAALAAWIVLALPQLLGRDWIGMGDAKLALLLGAALGWGVLAAVPLALICAFPVALVIVVRSGMRARNSTLPLGPFLALGALLVMFGPTLAGL
jgi:leader peptidase (prepilin peptidase)/N-methyltransferase